MSALNFNVAANCRFSASHFCFISRKKNYSNKSRNLWQVNVYI